MPSGTYLFVVLFNGFSCLEEFLGNYSYQSLESSLMVDEYSKILHHNCIRIRKEVMDNVSFLYSLRFLSQLSALTVWSIKVRSFYILGGHIQIIALYWGCIKLWYSHDYEIFPIFRTEYPMQWRVLIRWWSLRWVHLCTSSSLVKTDVEIIGI